jgi:hypothetical protein
MLLLKQSTAVTVKIGPFLDDSDGKTAETGLTISQAGVRLSKNGANVAQKHEASACTHDELGIYGCPLDATDTGTLGRLQLWVHESGALPVWHEFMVVPANVYDSLVSGSDYLQADTVQVEGSDATGQINAQVDQAIEDYHLDHLLAADYDPASKPGTATALLNELVENDGGVSRFTANALEEAPTGGSAPTVGEIADAVWDETSTGHVDAGKAGAQLWTDLDAILVDTGTTLDAIVDAIKAVTDKLDDTLEDDDGTYRFTENALEEAPTGGAAGSGGITFTYTLTSSVDSSPIPDASVWVTTDQAGSNVVASGTTDASGQVVFYLDAATYYVWRQKSGWNFSNPDTEVVS